MGLEGWQPMTCKDLYPKCPMHLHCVW